MHPSVGIAVIWSLTCASMSAAAPRAVWLHHSDTVSTPAGYTIRRPHIVKASRTCHCGPHSAIRRNQAMCIDQVLARRSMSQSLALQPQTFQQ